MSLPPQDNPDDQEFSEENESTEQTQPPRSRAIIAGLRRHKLAVVAIALISGFLLYTLVLDRPDNSSPPSESPPTTYVAVAPPTETEAEHGDGTDADHNTPMGVAGQYRVVARGFAQDFTTPGADWLERVSRWVTPHLAAAYTSTDIRRVQQAQLVDLAEYSTGASVSDFIATYDTGLELAIRVEYSSTGWQVSTCQPMKTAY